MSVDGLFSLQPLLCRHRLTQNQKKCQEKKDQKLVVVLCFNYNLFYGNEEKSDGTKMSVIINVLMI